MAGVSILVVALACITVLRAEQLTHLSPEANSFALKFIINSTTSLYNGTDLSKAVARSNLLLGMWSDKEHKLSEAAEKFASQKSEPGVESAQFRSDATEGDGEGRAPLPLVHSCNVTVEELFGPKYSGIIYDMAYQLWAKK